MVRRRPQVAVLVDDGPPAPTRAIGVDPHARQMVRWFSAWPVDAGAPVDEDAPHPHAWATGPSFEVVAVPPQWRERP